MTIHLATDHQLAHEDLMHTRMSCLTGFVAGLMFAAPALAFGQYPTAQRATSASPVLTAADSSLIGRERSQWEALKQQDTTAFGRLMGGGVVDVDLSGAKRTSPSSVARYVTSCPTAGYELADFRVAHFSATSVVTYKATVDQTCWGQKAPSPLYVMTVYEQQQGAWVPVAHSETPAAHW